MKIMLQCRCKDDVVPPIINVDKFKAWTIEKAEHMEENTAGFMKTVGKVAAMYYQELQEARNENRNKND